MVVSPLHACLLWPLASDRGSGFPLDSRLARVARAVNAVTPDIPSLTAILPFTGTHDCIAILFISRILSIHFFLLGLFCRLLSN
ncbi:unnamed protein product [Sphagnum jensenii]|uniref:Secreted peptide n=1 Tax=Sphagnum jensenii TaxID=128206 RepID=A0ABP0X4J4_9BRYO